SGDRSVLLRAIPNGVRKIDNRAPTWRAKSRGLARGCCAQAACRRSASAVQKLRSVARVTRQERETAPSTALSKRFDHDQKSFVKRLTPVADRPDSHCASIAIAGPASRYRMTLCQPHTSHSFSPIRGGGCTLVFHRPRFGCGHGMYLSVGSHEA